MRYPMALGPGPLVMLLAAFAPSIWLLTAAMLAWCVWAFLVTYWRSFGQWAHLLSELRRPHPQRCLSCRQRAIRAAQERLHSRRREIWGPPRR